MFANSHHDINPSIWPSSKDFNNPAPSGERLFTAMQWRAKTLSSCSRFRRFSTAGLIAAAIASDISGLMPFPEIASKANAWKLHPLKAKISSDVRQLELGQKAKITIQLSQAAYKVDRRKILVTGGTLSPWKNAGGYRTYTAIFTPEPNFKGTGTINVQNGVFETTYTNMPNVDEAEHDNSISIKINIDDDATQEVIGTFMQNRMRSLSAIQPDLTRFIDGSNIAIEGGQFTSLNVGRNPGSYSFGFATSLAEQWNRLDKNQRMTAELRMAEQPDVPSLAADAISSVSDAASMNELIEHPVDLLARQKRDHDIWMQLYGTRSNSGNSSNTVWAAYAGTHTHINDNLLVGMMGQLDWADEANRLENTAVHGTGWMIGPYMAARLPGENLFLESRFAWGRSENTIKQPLSSGTFDTTRLLVYGKVSGLYDFGNDIEVSPAVSVNYMREKQGGFFDNLGNTIAGQTAELGELRFGPSFSRQHMMDDGDMLTVSLGTTGIWSFAQNHPEGPTPVTAIGTDQVRARLDLGLERKTLDGRIINVEGFYDGIGANTYEAYGGKVSLSMPLQ